MKDDKKDDENYLQIKLKESKQDHDAFHEDWNNFLKLKPQIQKDYDRFLPVGGIMDEEKKENDENDDPPEEGDG